MSTSMVRWFSELGSSDVSLVGGKSASLGEMYNQLGDRGVTIPNGFSTTVEAYHTFMKARPGRAVPEEFEHLPEALQAAVASADTVADALRELFHADSDTGESELHERAESARAILLSTEVPEVVADAIREGYKGLCEEYGREVDTAVRSSATREDSEIASFAGQYESFLNVRGDEQVVDSWRRCVASGFTERAIGYQMAHDMDPLEGAVAVAVMKMVRADLATSGVLFTMDPDSGNRNVITVTSSYGLGEMVVQGAVSPDTFVVWKEGLSRGTQAMVHRRMGAKDRKMIYTRQGGTLTESVDVEAALRRRWSLTTEEVLELARMGLVVEEHYGRPMDVEWAKDGQTGRLFLVQARPETVHGQEGAGQTLETYRFASGTVGRLRDEGRQLLTGVAVGTRIGSGRGSALRVLRGGHPPQASPADAAEAGRRPRPDPARGAHLRPGRRAGHRNDDARLGTADEGGQPHRHRAGWPYLSRGHCGTRVRHSGHRRVRQRHGCPRAPSGGHRLLRRR